MNIESGELLRLFNRMQDIISQLDINKNHLISNIEVVNSNISIKNRYDFSNKSEILKDNIYNGINNAIIDTRELNYFLKTQIDKYNYYVEDAENKLKTFIMSITSTINKVIEVKETVNSVPTSSVKTVTLPTNTDTSVKTFMGWQKITSKTSNQYKLREMAGMNFDGEGFGIINDGTQNRYVIATTTKYGTVGDYLDIYQEDGSVLHCIIGDIKGSADPNYSVYGHTFGSSINVVEFIVDMNSWYSGGRGAHANPGTSSFHPEMDQNIIKVENMGSYFG